MSAIGDNKLMAVAPDCKSVVINGKSGYTRDNSSWIVGRLVRDFHYWKDHEVQTTTDKILDEKWGERKKNDTNEPRPVQAGLTVSIYEPRELMIPGKVERDVIYWIGLPVILLQLGVAAIPCGLYGDWGILLITFCGNLLAICTGLLSQWKQEKWACRTKAKQSFVLTKGNGSQHAIAILGNGKGFDFEDLASGQNSNTLPVTNCTTRLKVFSLACLWVLLLVTAAGLKKNTWFLLAVGAIGVLQNIYVAGAQRNPNNFGIPLRFVTVFGNVKVMETLLEVESNYKDLGRSMIGTFFPGPLRADETARWDALKAKWAEKSKKEENGATQH